MINSLKIQYASDLHLEFSQNQNFLENFPLEPIGEILILAGDIVPLARIEDFTYFFDKISADFKTVYWIPGNHEYYHYDLSKNCGSFKEKVRENVWLLNNQVIEHEEYRFIFSTLWSHISEQNATLISQRLNDFRLIKYNKNLLTPAIYNSKHEENLDFLKNELRKESDLKTVVVTHHVPTYSNYPAKYNGSLINEAFTVELQNLIQETQPEYWIYGHHHFNNPDFKIGNTCMLTNQLGYIAYKEHKDFRLGKTL